MRYQFIRNAENGEKIYAVIDKINKTVKLISVNAYGREKELDSNSCSNEYDKEYSAFA